MNTCEMKKIGTIFAEISLNYRLESKMQSVNYYVNQSTVIHIDAHSGFSTALEFFEALQNKAFASLCPLASHALTYGSACHKVIGGPLQDKNNKDDKWSVVSWDLSLVQIKFIWLNPLSHDALLIEIVLTAVMRGSKSFGTWLMSSFRSLNK